MDRNKNIASLLEGPELIETLKNKIGYYDGDVIFLAGSLIESKVNSTSYQIGNKFSDIDVFVLRGEENFKKEINSDFEDAAKQTMFFEALGYSFDVEIYDIKKVEQILHYIEKIEVDENVRLKTSLDFPEGYSMRGISSLLHRFRNSLPIINLRKYEELQKTTPYQKFSSLYCLNLIARIDSYRPDILGNYHEGNHDAVIGILRESFLLFLQFIVYTNNESVDRMKWVITKFRNLNNSYTDIENHLDKLYYGEIKTEEVEKLVKSTLILMDEFIEEYTGDI